MNKNSIKLKKVDLGLDIDFGAPLPTILANENKLLLLFHKIFQKDNEVIRIIFKNYVSFKFGLPSEDSSEGHPYSKYGLGSEDVVEVINSDWIKEIDKIEQSSEDYDKDRFNKLKHYIFLFHDSTFECIAESFEIEELKGKSRADALTKAIKKLEE